MKSKSKLFVGSSMANVEVARETAIRLEALGCGYAKVWDEGIFTLSQGVLERLMTSVKEFDFAIIVWAADDLTQSKGESKASPRDNVIFECGLFMGALGRDKVFVAADSGASVKIPSDFDGIMVAQYDGERFKEQGGDALRDACSRIAAAIKRRRNPYEKFEGEWRSRYAKAAELEHGEVIDDVDIESVSEGILIKSRPIANAEPYSARGTVHTNQIMGTWQHSSTHSYAEGLFMLVSPLADVMYGYCTGRNENGAMIFETWVLVKKADLSESKINAHLVWGEQALKSGTIVLPMPEADHHQ